MNVVLLTFALIGLGSLWVFYQLYRMNAMQKTPEEQGKLHDNLVIARDKAAQGDGDSQLRLGLAYSRGIGLQKSYSEAFFWLSLAQKNKTTTLADQGAFIGNFLKDAGSMLSDAERAAVDQRLATWQPGLHAADTVELREAPVIVP